MAKLIITAPDENLIEYAQLAVDQLQSGFTSGHHDPETYWDLETDKEWS